MALGKLWDLRMDIWDRRRRNLAAVLAYKGIRPAQAAEMSGLSVNTVGKFIRGETHSMRQQTLDKLCESIGLANSAILDADNPLSEAKNQLYSLVSEMSDDRAAEVLALIESSRAGGAS